MCRGTTPPGHTARSSMKIGISTTFVPAPGSSTFFSSYNSSGTSSTAAFLSKMLSKSSWVGGEIGGRLGGVGADFEQAERYHRTKMHINKARSTLTLATIPPQLPTFCRNTYFASGRLSKVPPSSWDCARIPASSCENISSGQRLLFLFPCR